MKRGLVNYRITPSMNDGSVIVRKARKEHRCSGHNGQERTSCLRPIPVGSIYIEYLGESAAYESGARYHIECAAEHERLLP
jgi:hypothetical protein